jgi:hypothetical protein
VVWSPEVQPTQGAKKIQMIDPMGWDWVWRKSTRCRHLRSSSFALLSFSLIVAALNGVSVVDH